MQRGKWMLISGIGAVIGTSAYMINSSTTIRTKLPIQKSSTLTNSNKSPPFKPLSLSETNKTLQENQFSWKGYLSSKNTPLLFCDVSFVASNDPIEDYQLASQYKNITMFGIFDGHSGTECADIVSRYLDKRVIESLNKQRKESTTTTSHNLIIEAAIKEAFCDLDKDIISGNIPDFKDPDLPMSEFRPAVAGSCALFTLIDTERIYIAWTGDSRAVLGSRNKIDGSFRAIQLSDDHTAKNPREYDRILYEHPGELETVISRGRVLGGLMPTRAFGDAKYKWSNDFANTILPYFSRRPSKNSLTPPYVTAEPQVISISRSDINEGDFIVLASDGLYDELENEEIVQLLSFKLHKPITKNEIKCLNHDSDNLATHLIRNALSGPEKNIENVCKVLGIPNGKSRRYRDDITVNVLVFGNQLTVNEKNCQSIPFLDEPVNLVSKLNGLI